MRTLAAKQAPPNAANKAADKRFLRRVEHLRTECNEDRRERQSVESSSREFLRAAMRHYLKALHFASGDSNRAVYRVLGLWFSNWRLEFTSEIVREAFLEVGGGGASVVPIGKLVPLVYQLTSRLCAADIPVSSSSTTTTTTNANPDSRNSFKATLEEMITKMCVSHPFHCLPHLYAFFHGDRVPSGASSSSGDADNAGNAGNAKPPVSLNSTTTRKV